MSDHEPDPNHADAEPVLSTLLAECPELGDIVERFARGLPDRLQEMQDALRLKSFEHLAKIAHQLKGAGGSHGFAALTRQAGTIEQTAHAGAIQELTAQLDDMTDLVARIQSGLQMPE